MSHMPPPLPRSAGAHALVSRLGRVRVVSAGGGGVSSGAPMVMRVTVEPERVVLLRPRTVLSVAAVLLGVAIALWVVWISRRVITWVLVAVFLSLALNPAVRVLQQRGIKRRGAAAAIIYLSAILVVALLAALLVPPLVDQA